MDIFQKFISNQPQNISSFSTIFNTANDFQQLLGHKSYLLNHYLSIFFNLITEIDFCNLEDEIYDSISKLQKKIRIDLENNSNLFPVFNCQELSTNIELCWTALADSLLEQAVLEFYNEYTYSGHMHIDMVDMRQTEEKLAEIIGKESWEKFQQQLINCFIPCSLMQLFCQGIVIEITKHFLSRDLETDQEIFRLYLNHFLQK